MPKKLIFTLCLIVFLLAIARILVANVFANSGGKLALLEEKISTVELRNQQLEEEIAHYSSLANLLFEAERQEFIKVPEIIFLTPQVSVALR